MSQPRFNTISVSMLEDVDKILAYTSDSYEEFQSNFTDKLDIDTYTHMQDDKFKDPIEDSTMEQIDADSMNWLIWP